MKQPLVILVIFLLLLPIFRSGLAFTHYILVHTHLFCQNDLVHQHHDDCLTLTILRTSQPQDQLPSPLKHEVSDIKQYYLVHPLNVCSINHLAHEQMIFATPFSLDTFYAKEIFHPPILA